MPKQKGFRQQIKEAQSVAEGLLLLEKASWCVSEKALKRCNKEVLKLRQKFTK